METTASTDPASNPPAVTRQQMRLVLDVSRMLAITADLDALLQRIAESTTALLSCERASIFLHDPATDQLWTKVALQSAEIRVAADAGIVGFAFRGNQSVHCPDAYADARFNREPDRNSGFTTRNLLTAPMVDWDDNPVGVIQALNKVGGPFTETDISLLRLLADQAGVAIQRWRLQQAAVQSTSLRHEMNLAKRVQEAAIPKTPPAVPGYLSAGWTRPASINGGDAYDLWRLPDGGLGVLVADASGHGIAPALVVSQMRSLVRALADESSHPQHILERVNNRLAQDLERGRFVTAFLGFLSPDGTLQWCSAGHGPMVLNQPSGPVLLNATLPPLGILDEFPPEEPPPPAHFIAGGSLVVPSDGILEAFNPGGEMFAVERLIETINHLPRSEPKAAIAAVRDAVVQWQQKEEPADDQTLVIVRREAV